MTTPVPDLFDWAQLANSIRDVESARYVRRLIEMQRQTLDAQVAQLNELAKQLDARIGGMGGGQTPGSGPTAK